MSCAEELLELITQSYAKSKRLKEQLYVLSAERDRTRAKLKRIKARHQKAIEQDRNPERKHDATQQALRMLAKRQEYNRSYYLKKLKPRRLRQGSSKMSEHAEVYKDSTTHTQEID